ncbi:MAG: AI-2E family transporter [Leptospiraceae bacterium]|nr:AI-2E family transporter [Leptospiraceae bacterium]
MKGKVLALAIIIGSLFIATCIFMFFVFRTYFWATFISCILYIATRDAYNKIKNSFPKILVGLSPWVMICLVSVVFIVPVIFIIRTLISEAMDLLTLIKLSLSEDRIVSTLLNFPILTDYFSDSEFFWVQLPETYREIVGSYGDILNIDSLYGILSNASTFIIGSIELPTGIIMNVFFSLLLLFFFYKDGHKIEMFFLSNLPFSKEIEEKIGLRATEAVKAVISGNIFISFLQGVVIGFALMFAGIPSPFFYASIAAIFSLIPIIGTMVVWLPAGLYIGFIENDWVVAIVLMVTSLASYLILENFIKPKMLDKKLNLHSFLLFLSLIGGIKEFGIMGLVIGPLTITFLVILWDFWKMYRNGELKFLENQ